MMDRRTRVWVGPHCIFLLTGLLIGVNGRPMSGALVAMFYGIVAAGRRDLDGEI